MDGELAFFCKSFRPDFDHLKVMIDSFFAHNPEGIRLVLSLPDADTAAFHNQFGKDLPNIDVVADESYCGHDLKKFRGWHSQQICKLASWRVANFDHLVVVDSDCYFFRDVSRTEFLPREKRYVAYGSTIRTVMHPRNEDLIRYLKGELAITSAHMPPAHGGGDKSLADFVHYKDVDLDNPGAVERSGFLLDVFGAKRWIFYQPGQIFSRGILQALGDYLEEYGLTLGDAILISPWEYNWYGEFACRFFHDQTQFRVPSVLHFASEADIAYMRQQGISDEQIAGKFAFIAMAARHMKLLKLECLVP
jgi:hypothetical protein